MITTIAILIVIFLGINVWLLRKWIHGCRSPVRGVCVRCGAECAPQVSFCPTCAKDDLEYPGS